MTDIRERVTEDRGLIKKIQMAIPGYRGYRIREDLRIADSMLRLQIADRMRDEVLKPLEDIREVCSRELELDLMNDIAAVISAAKTTEAKIRHAEQGYSGISPAYRVADDELNTLYEYDLSLLGGVNDLAGFTAASLSAAEGGDFATVKANAKKTRTAISELQSQFGKRIETMANLGAI